MKAIVINLDSATERMAFQEQQLKSLNIDFERLPAFRIENEKDSFFLKFFNTWQRPLSVSEVSCFFSHKKAWDRIIKEDKPMLVLEDDALLTKITVCILQELYIQKNIDYVTLEERKNRKKLLAKSSKSQFCDVSLIRLYQGRSGAAGYVLWPSGAKKLLKQMNKKGIGIADKFINENYSLKAYQIEPANIIQLDQCHLHGIEQPIEVNTSIKPRSTSTKDKKKWRFQLKRIMGELKVGLNQIFHIHNANRRTIKISDHFEKAKRSD